MKKIAFLALGISMAIPAFAANVVGKYSGKLNLDFSAIKTALKAKAAKDPNMKSQLETQLNGLDQASKALASSVIQLELKKDGTLTMTQSTSGKKEAETGKWTLNGNKIKLSGLSSKNGGPSELNGVVSKDGKTIVFDLNAELKKQSAKQPGMPAPTGNLTFKKA